jgi:hypothetical protein
MKTRILFVIASLILIVCPNTFAQKEKKDSKIDVKSLQLRGADSLLTGVNQFIDYLIAKRDSSYFEAQRNLNVADSIFEKLLTCCSSSTDTAKLSQLYRALEKATSISLTDLQEMAEGRRVNLQFDGRIVELSEQEAGLFTFLKILGARTEDFVKDLATIYFSHVWSTGKGYFKMRAHVDQSWQEKLINIGLEDKFLPVIVQMTNKLRRDVVLNPFTEKFTILTSTGKQFRNVDVDFDTQIILEDLTDEEKQLIFNKVMEIYDGADTPIVILFPSSVPSPGNWLRIIFDSSVGEYGESLSKGNLNKEQ